MSRNFVYLLFSAFIGAFVLVCLVSLAWPRIDPVNLRLAELGFTEIVRPSSRVSCDTGMGEMFVATNAIGGVVVGKICPGNLVHVMISTTKDYPRA